MPEANDIAESRRRRSRGYAVVGAVAIAGAIGTTSYAVLESDRTPTLWVDAGPASPGAVSAVSVEPLIDTANESAATDQQSALPSKLRRDERAAPHASPTGASSGAVDDRADRPVPITRTAAEVFEHPGSRAPDDPHRGDDQPRAAPVRLRSSRISLESFDVRAVALRDDGWMEVPDETEIGWYEPGAAPGHDGVTVLAAHVSWNGSIGPFAYIADLRAGDVLEVDTDDGGTRSYEVVGVSMYPKESISQQDLWRRVGPERLALITCGGEFDDERNRFRHNIVVVADPINDVVSR